MSVLWRRAGTGLVAVARELIPAACPVCRSVAKPRWTVACEACLGALKCLPAPRCNGCGGRLDGALNLCAECLRGDRKPWRWAVSSWAFSGLARHVIHRFKYQGETYLAPVLAAAMVTNWRDYGTVDVDLVVPVPLHWTRQLTRGYNQAELLAELVAADYGLPCVRTLTRRRGTTQQAMLNFEQRQRNMNGVFRASVKRLAGRRVLLVDDVMTTGATLAEAACALINADAAAVNILTAARG